MTSRRGVWVLAVVLSFAQGSAIGSGHPCADRIVSIGDSRAELARKCGEPDWKEARSEETIEAGEKGEKKKVIITVEDWTYNLGPDRFMRVFKMRDNKVTSVETGGYGFAKEPSRPIGCGDRIISVGDRAAEVLAKCGEPVWKDRREEIIKERIDEKTERKATVVIEEWTYDFGPDRFTRIVTLRNSRVSEVGVGGYGAERK